MPDVINPYVPGQPVDNPDLFFGRRDVLASIRENLVKGRRVFVVSGAQRMGKTSLLRQLPAHLPDEVVPVRVELAEENAQRLDWLLWRLADAIGQQVSQQLGAEGLESAWADFEGHTDHLLDQFWPQARVGLGDRYLVLMLDDLDCLAQEEVSLLDPLLAVLSTWRDRDKGLAVVLTTSVAWQEALVREHPRLFGGALTYVLGPLSSEEATRLISWPVDGTITYDYGVARRLIESTSGQPYYLQLLCFEVFNRCALAGWANQRDVDLVIEDLVGRELADFRQVWDESSPQEQAALAALVSLRGARGIATAQEVRTVLTKAGARVERRQVTEILDSLATRGILERLGALSYRFRVALLRDWLGERIDLLEVVRDTRWDTADQERLSRDRHVSRLRVRKERQKVPGGPMHGPTEATDPGEEGRPAPGRRWMWIAVVAVLGFLALAVLGWILVPFPLAEPTPTVTLPPSPLARSATAAMTSVPETATEPAVPVAPADTPTPRPTATQTPTRPVIVARPVPSIAYQSRGAGEQQWSVFLMDSDGSNRTWLTDGEADFLSAPSWAPDGSKISFVSNRDGAPDIWVMSTDGNDLANLTQHEAKDHSPAWSPDGQWIAFASVRDSLFWELYVMRADGSDLQRLTWWEDASDLWPTWSPDGTRLAFASKRDGNWEIYAMDRDGSNLMRLTNHSADDTHPSWSPDGSRIAFESTREGYTEIYVMPVVGGEAVNISNTTWATDLGPTWSPDGGRIAFYSDRDGEWDIYVMASDGSGVIKLTGDNSNDQVPAWRP
jgi:hypothetical protein